MIIQIIVILCQLAAITHSAPIEKLIKNGATKHTGWSKTLEEHGVKSMKIPVIHYYIRNECCGAFCRDKCKRVKLELRYGYKSSAESSTVIGHIIIPGPTNVNEKKSK